MRISDWSSDVCSSDLWQRADPRYGQGDDRRSHRGRGAGAAAPARRAARLQGHRHLRRRICGPDPLSLFDLRGARSEEHTSELQSLMRISYAVFCLKKKTTHTTISATTLYTRINRTN